MIDSKYRAFLAAAEYNNLTRVGEYLGYTQSGISHLISSLEEELQLTLLIRSRKGTVLTDVGRKILPYIQRLQEADLNMQKVAEDLRDLTSGSLSVGTFSSVAVSWLPRILAAFHQEYPEVEVCIRNGTYAEVEQDLKEHRVECAFMSTALRSEFEIMPIASDQLMVVLQKNHPFARQSYIEPEKLIGQSLILPAEGSNYDIGEIFFHLGVPIKVQYDVRDDYAAAMLAGLGVGITILPKMLTDQLGMANICAIPLEHTKRTIGIATALSSEKCSLAVIRWIDIVKKVMSEECI